MADDEDVTVIQVVRGQDTCGTACRGLTEAQKTGRACLHCGGDEGQLDNLGWINGEIRGKAHPWHLDAWRTGRTSR